MSGAAYNPWTLQTYFETVAYTLVYSSNLGFDEFFMLSAFFTYVKLEPYFNKLEKRPSIEGFVGIWLRRYARVAPAYYAVFLIGWLVGPYTNSGPWWFTYQMGFCNCSQFWWSVLAMTINFFPGYAVANEGCFYWGWFVACQMQLFLVLPPLVYLFAVTLKNRPIVQSVALLGLMALGSWISYRVLLTNDMSAGLFAPQDIIIFKVWLNKPHTKLHCLAWGIAMAKLFTAINAHKLRNPKADVRRVACRGWLRSKWAAWAVFACAFSVLAFVSIYPKSVNGDPASWSAHKSALFVALSHNAFLACVVAIFGLMWLGYGAFFKRHFSRVTWRVLSRLSFGVYLAFPVVAALFNSSMKSALYLTYNEMVYQLIFSVASSFFAALLLFVLVEAPLKNVLASVVSPSRGMKSK